MAKPILLNIDYDYDFMLFAITAHEADYKFCQKINKQLFLNLEREEALELKNKNQTDNLLFSFYAYVTEEEQIEYNLLGNKSFNQVLSNKAVTSNQGDLFGGDEPEISGQKGYLIPELSSYDYLMIVRVPYDPQEAYAIENQLKEIDSVLKVQFVEVADLGSKNNLIF